MKSTSNVFLSDRDPCITSTSNMSMSSSTARDKSEFRFIWHFTNASIHMWSSYLETNDTQAWRPMCVSYRIFIDHIHSIHVSRMWRTQHLRRWDTHINRDRATHFSCHHSRFQVQNVNRKWDKAMQSKSEQKKNRNHCIVHMRLWIVCSFYFSRIDRGHIYRYTMCAEIAAL